ncbi:MAG: hypothetical protein EAZ95_04370 [Bacteroidetes bacterium]|nr:MAG: hypothetical protein EAZ95_04370 [Bacteroidota bacterium]
MHIGFTIVTNSFLAHARSLQESFLKHNPDFRFYIGLLDAPLPDEDLTDVVLATDLALPYWEEMHQRYTPFELSCAMKPYFASYFAEKFDFELIIYLDSDMRVYASFEYLKDLRAQSAIFLTPHLTAHAQENGAVETGLLRSGTYNAGFFAVSNLPESKLFLEWWKTKLRTQCYAKVEQGLFVDQLWLNLVPTLFEKCCVIKHQGYNVAYWNFWEREADNVVFFHFSGYDVRVPDAVSKYADLAITFENFPAFKPFFEDYRESVERFGYARYQGIKSTVGATNLPTNAQPKKRKSYLSVLWKAIKGEIVIEK